MSECVCIGAPLDILRKDSSGSWVWDFPCDQDQRQVDIVVCEKEAETIRLSSKVKVGEPQEGSQQDDV